MTIQRTQALGLLGILGSLGRLSLNTVLSPDWGPPGSPNYLGYETINASGRRPSRWCFAATPASPDVTLYGRCGWAAWASISWWAACF